MAHAACRGCGFDAAARRLSLYRAYLYLIMWVEAVPRQFAQSRRDQLT
ncbi:MAG TPA: hypothetical protein VMV92_03230 [Streptosporangiaceae bacterium]|nr:hypothetical protein [Streptosporangiaceae bacterium]